MFEHSTMILATDVEKDNMHRKEREKEMERMIDIERKSKRTKKKKDKQMRCTWYEYNK